MMKFLSPKIHVFFVIISIFFASFSYSSDFSYEIRDPRASTADDYLTTTNVSIKEESDFVYWYPSASTAPNKLIFHFEFNDPVTEGDIYFRTDTFNWGNDAYASIYASTDGLNWITLKETGPPATTDGWNNGTYSSDLPSQLLGHRNLYFKASLSVFRDSIRRAGIYAQALRYQKSTDNLTFRLNASFNTPKANESSILPIISKFLMQPKKGIARLDPTEIGGVGAEIFYKGKFYSTPVNVQENALIGIMKDGKAYLYHKNLGKDVTFSDETNRKAVGYAIMDIYNSSPPSTALSKAPLKSSYSKGSVAPASNNTPISKFKTNLSSGIECTIIDSKIRITNKAFRWAAVEVYKNINGDSYETQTYYLAPKSYYLDQYRIYKMLMPRLGYSGDSVDIDSEGVFKIDVHAAVVKGWPKFLTTGVWPGGYQAANISNEELVNNLNRLELMYLQMQLTDNFIDVSVPECAEPLVTLSLDLVKMFSLQEMTADERVLSASAAGLGFDMINGFTDCVVTGTAAAAGNIAGWFIAEVVYTTIDLVLTANWLTEEIAYGSYMIFDLDAYNKINLTEIKDLSIDTTPKTDYAKGESLDLNNLKIKVLYSDSTSLGNDDIFWSFNDYNYNQNISSSLEHGQALSLGDTPITFTLLKQELSILNANATPGNVIMSYSKSIKNADLDIEVLESTEPGEPNGPCPMLYDQNSGIFDTPLPSNRGYWVGDTVCRYDSVTNYLYYEYPYKDGNYGVLHGTLRVYYTTGTEAGQIHRTTDYVDDVKHGHEKSYDTSGQLDLCWIYDHGNYTGSCM